MLADPSISTPNHTPPLLLQENKTQLATHAGLLLTLLPVLRFIAHSNSLFAILEGAARFAAIVPQVQKRYYPPSSVHIRPRLPSIPPPYRASSSVMSVRCPLQLHPFPTPPHTLTP